jgi:hypothetical protein
LGFIYGESDTVLHNRYYSTVRSNSLLMMEAANHRKCPMLLLLTNLSCKAIRSRRHDRYGDFLSGKIFFDEESRAIKRIGSVCIREASTAQCLGLSLEFFRVVYPHHSLASPPTDWLDDEREGKPLFSQETHRELLDAKGIRPHIATHEQGLGNGQCVRLEKRSRNPLIVIPLNGFRKLTDNSDRRPQPGNRMIGKQDRVCPKNSGTSMEGSFDACVGIGKHPIKIMLRIGSGHRSNDSNFGRAKSEGQICPAIGVAARLQGLHNIVDDRRRSYLIKNANWTQFTHTSGLYVAKGATYNPTLLLAVF